MKGLELPVNVLVVVAIAVIVLLGVIALYFGGWTPFSTGIGVESAKNGACAELVRRGCSLGTNTIILSSYNIDFDADRDGLTSTSSTVETTSNTFNWAAEATVFCGLSNNVADSLASLCKCFYGKDSEVECKQLCGCM